MWLAAVDPAAWGALGTGGAALLGALFAIYKGTRQTPSRAFQLIDELQEDNGRLRKALRGVEETLWLTNEARQREHEDCRRRIEALERQVSRRSSTRRSEPRG